MSVATSNDRGGAHKHEERQRKEEEEEAGGKRGVVKGRKSKFVNSPEKKEEEEEKEVSTLAVDQVRGRTVAACTCMCVACLVCSQLLFCATHTRTHTHNSLPSPQSPTLPPSNGARWATRSVRCVARGYTSWNGYEQKTTFSTDPV